MKKKVVVIVILILSIIIAKTAIKPNNQFVSNNKPRVGLPHQPIIQSKETIALYQKVNAARMEYNKAVTDKLSEEKIKEAKAKLNETQNEFKKEQIKLNPQLAERYAMMDKIREARERLENDRKSNASQSKIDSDRKDFDEAVNKFREDQMKNNPEMAKIMQKQNDVRKAQQKLQEDLKNKESEAVLTADRKSLFELQQNMHQPQNEDMPQNNRPSPEMLDLQKQLSKNIKDKAPKEVIDAKMKKLQELQMKMHK